MAFERHPFAKERRCSAVVLVKMLLQDIPGPLPEHRWECLKNLALWKITEAEGLGKFKTRFRSEASLSPSKHLRHDHVFQRANMVKVLMEASPEAVDEILKKAVGCTITKDEHDLLGRFQHLDGWERYRRAGIVVIDMETGKPFEFHLRRKHDVSVFRFFVQNRRVHKKGFD